MTTAPPTSTKLRAHGAVLGGGTGVGLAGLIVGLVQAHIARTALAPVDIQAIYAGVSVLGAFYGTWMVPLLSRVDPGAIAAVPQPPPPGAQTQLTPTVSLVPPVPEAPPPAASPPYAP